MTNTSTISTTFLGEKVAFRYDMAAAATDGWLQGAVEGTNVPQQLAKIALWWDVLDEQGRPLLPPDYEMDRIAAWRTIFSSIPVSLLASVYRQVIEDMCSIYSAKAREVFRAFGLDINQPKGREPRTSRSKRRR